MQTAYDPIRIRRLVGHTTTAIEALAMIRSADPDAADALRTIRLLRRNLEDLWMPLLMQIESSTALITWIDQARTMVPRGEATIIDWISDRSNDPRSELHQDLTDDELLELIDTIDNEGLPFDGRNGLDLDDSAWTTTFAPIAIELARRVAADPGFAARLIDAAFANPVIGLAVGVAHFPPAFVRDAAMAMLHHTSWMDDFASRSEAAAASTLLAGLLDTPGMCLDVLVDPKALYELAAWPLLDQRVVESFIHAGLYTAVAITPSRLVEGYATISALTGFAKDQLNDGFGAGMSRGVATSMIGYVDSLGRGITKEDGGIVQIDVFDSIPGNHDGFTFSLGSYEEVRNLFGALARDVEAQAAIGVTIGMYMNHIVEDLGSDIMTRSGIEHVAQLADLVGDAVTAEQAEMVAAAAAATMRRGMASTVVGFGVSAAVSTIGPGAVGAFAISQVVKAGTDALTKVDPRTMPNGMVRHVTHDAIVVAVVTLARHDRDTQSANELDRDDHAAQRRVDEYLTRLKELDVAGDMAGYAVEVATMTSFIETHLPALDAFVNKARMIPAVHDLEEGHP